MFTLRKFLSFPLERQHKKCAELLRNAYESLIDKRSSCTALENYNTLQSWMGRENNLERDPKQIADRYHSHLRQANCRLRENNLLPSIRRFDKPVAKAAPAPIAIFLDRLRSAHNVGSILRTAEALALGSIHFSPGTPFIDNKQVQDTSMGTYQWVECKENAKLEDLPKPVIVMETSGFAVPIHEFLFPEAFTLVVGNEEYGCADATLQQADYLIEIPLQGRKNSLNVANAFAICAAEIQRQKHIRGLPLLQS